MFGILFDSSFEVHTVKQSGGSGKYSFHSKLGNVLYLLLVTAKGQKEVTFEMARELFLSDKTIVYTQPNSLQ